MRVGNGAVDQYQGDVFGEVMLALEQARAAASTRTSSPGRCSAP